MKIIAFNVCQTQKKSMKFSKFIYFVEGECEKHLISENNRLPNPYLKVGRVEVFNFLTKDISVRKIISIDKNSLVVIIFDTDINCDLKIIERNTKMLDKYKVNYIFILEDKNFEDEILNATDVKQLKDLFKSKSNSDFKKDFVKANNVFSTLNRHNFNIDKFWCYKNKNEYFKDFISQGGLIKIKQFSASKRTDKVLSAK